MAQALKVGDRVRVARRWTDLIGREFVIEEVGGSGETARFPGPRPRFIHFNALEKIDPEPKFKIGDRVRITAPYAAEGYRGIVHVVSDVTHEYVYLDGNARESRAGWFPTSLTKIEPVPFKLERGDRVVNIRTGREGEVIHDLVFDVKPPFGAPVPVKAIEEYEEHRPGTYDLIKKDPPW